MEEDTETHDNAMVFPMFLMITCLQHKPLANDKSWFQSMSFSTIVQREIIF